MRFLVIQRINGYHRLGGCSYCSGALLEVEDPTILYEKKVIKCFHCGRMFKRDRKNQFILWPFKRYEHLQSKIIKREEGKYSRS